MAPLSPRAKRVASPPSAQSHRVAVPRRATPRGAGRSAGRTVARAASAGCSSISRSAESGRPAQGHSGSISTRRVGSVRTPHPHRTVAPCSTPRVDFNELQALYEAQQHTGVGERSRSTSSYLPRPPVESWHEPAALDVRVGDKLEKIIEGDRDCEFDFYSSESSMQKYKDEEFVDSSATLRSSADKARQATCETELPEASANTRIEANIQHSDEEAFLDEVPPNDAPVAWMAPAVGDRVLARIAAYKRWYGATITRAWADGSWRIAWDDGDPQDQFKFSNQLQLLREGFAEYRVGDKVLARYKSKPTWYMATIEQVLVNGVFTIIWNDGDKKDRVKNADELAPRAVPPAPALKLQRSAGVDKYVPRTRSPRKKVRKETYTRLWEDAQRRACVVEGKNSKMGRHVS